MSTFGDIVSSATSFAANTMIFSGGSSKSGRRSSPRSSKSGPRQKRQSGIELTPMSKHGRSHISKKSAKKSIGRSAGKRVGLSTMSRQRKGAKKPGLSDMLRKGYDAFNTNKAAYKSVKSDPPKGSSDKQLSPLQRNFSNNPERAARQEAFVNKYMPHLKVLSKFQSGMEKMARGMLGIPDKPKKAGVTENHWQDLSKVERKADSHSGFDSQDLARQAKHMDFIKEHMPALSPLVSMQRGLQKSFQKLMGMPTKTPELPTMGQKIDKAQTGNTEEREQRSPLERNFSSNDPERAARQKAFVDKYMPHVAALSKLQSSMENAVRSAIKGPKDSSVDPKAGVGATS